MVLLKSINLVWRKADLMCADANDARVDDELSNIDNWARNNNQQD